MLEKKKPPGNGSGPGGRGHHTAADRADNTTIATATQQQANRQQCNQNSKVAVAFAALLLAPPGAVNDRLLVKSCPVRGCSYAHLHYVPVGTVGKGPIIRPPRCRPWLRYRIEITAVVPAPAVPGRCRRGAA